MGGNVSFIAFSVFARQLIAVTFEGLCRFVPNLTCAAAAPSVVGSSTLHPSLYKDLATVSFLTEVTFSSQRALIEGALPIPIFRRISTPWISPLDMIWGVSEVCLYVVIISFRSK